MRPDSHADYDAGENGGAMTDSDYYEAITKGEREGTAPGQAAYEAYQKGTHRMHSTDGWDDLRSTERAAWVAAAQAAVAAAAAAQPAAAFTLAELETALAGAIQQLIDEADLDLESDEMQPGELDTVLAAVPPCDEISPWGLRCRVIRAHEVHFDRDHNRWPEQPAPAAAPACPDPSQHRDVYGNPLPGAAAAQPAPELDQLLTDVYACTRDWSAWQYGTMTEADFTPAAETDLRADLIAWREAAAQPASGVTLEALRAAIEAHQPDHGMTQWYVDECGIDCDADEFWAVIGAALGKQPAPAAADGGPCPGCESLRRQHAETCGEVGFLAGALGEIARRTAGSGQGLAIAAHGMARGARLHAGGAAPADGLAALVRDMLQSFPDTADEQEWRDRAGALGICDPDGKPYRAWTEEDM